jgi:hypothetical protein
MWKQTAVAWACLGSLSVARGQDTHVLAERLAEGGKYNVRMRVEITGTLTPPAAKGKRSSPVTMEGASHIDYDERVLATDGKGNVTRTVRYCDQLTFKRTISGQPQELTLRNAVRRLVVLRKGHTEVPFSPDGPLTWGEIDAVRTDVFVPALLGLLPTTAVAVGARWNAAAGVVQELTDLDKVNGGSLECKLDRLSNIGLRRFARVTFTGTIDGVGEDGPVRHKLQGHYTFDLEGRYLADLTLLGTAIMVDEAGKEAGKVDGRLVLTRTMQTRASAIGDEAIRNLKLEPDDDNTRMLYDNADLGLRFLFSRRWHVAQVMGAQVALATKDGNGILVTVDPPENVPNANAFLEESRGWLVKQKAKVTKTYSPRRLREKPALDAFALEAEMGAQKLWLDYYVTSQSGGGATVAARLNPDGLGELRREAEAVAKSLVITKRIVARPTKK